MGLFSALGKIIQGKPVFENEDDDTSDPDEDVARGGRPQKTFAVVEAGRVQSHRNRDRLEIWAFLTNRSPYELVLDKVRIFGATRELDTILKPGQNKQFLLFSGSAPQDQHQDQCQIIYRDPTGDYFAAVHNIEFELEPDHSLSVSELHLEMPIRDV